MLVALAFAIPIEHKYDKLFRFYSLTLIPEGVTVSQSYEKKIYFYISDLIAITLFCFSLFWYRTPLRKLFGNPLWFVFLAALISIVASPFIGYPIPYIRLLQLFTPIALFSFISTSFSDEEKGGILRYTLIAIVAAGLFQTAVAIGQYFHQGPLGLRLLGETNQTTIFNIKDGSRWIFDQLLNRKSDSTVVIRAAGTFPHANVFGGFMVLSILSTYALLMQSVKKNWILLSTLPLQFFAMCLSFSRSALFAWAIGTLIWFVLMFRQFGMKNQRLRQIGTVTLSFFLLTSALLYNQYANRGGVISYTNLAKHSDDIRKFHQVTALSILKSHPISGLGFTQYSERSGPYFPSDATPYVKATAPHNMFLFLASETGLLSLLALLLWLYTLFITSIRSPITIESATFLSLFIGFIFIGCCDFYPIFFQHGKLMFFLIASLLSISHLQSRPSVVNSSAT